MAHMLARTCATWGPGLIVPPFTGAIPIGAILTLHGDEARWQLPGKEPGIEDIIGVLEFAIGLFGSVDMRPFPTDKSVLYTTILSLVLSCHSTFLRVQHDENFVNKLDR